MPNKPTTPKRPRGRPPGTGKPKEEKYKLVTISLPPHQAERLKELGGSPWVQKQIELARQ